MKFQIHVFYNPFSFYTSLELKYMLAIIMQNQAMNLQQLLRGEKPESEFINGIRHNVLFKNVGNC